MRWGVSVFLGCDEMASAFPWLELGRMLSLPWYPANTNPVSHSAKLFVNARQCHLAEERERWGTFVQQRIHDFVVFGVWHPGGNQMGCVGCYGANLISQASMIKKRFARYEALHEQVAEDR